jgi:hypothetical protein
MPDVSNLPSPVAVEYVKLMLSGEHFEDADKVLALHYQLTRYKMQEYMLQKKWQAAWNLWPMKIEFDPEPVDSQYAVLLNRALHLPRRNSTLAATMSVVVPGAGKMYCGEWKDALISFFFVTFSAYESVHAFKVAGPGSYMGYIYGGLAVGFYGGSVYGSYKSAKRYNARQNELILEDAKAIILSTY